MTEFAHAVNFTMSFGCTVLPEDINKQREWLEKTGETLYLWDLEINKNSTDEEIANYLGLENYRDYFLTEAVEMEMEEHHVYDAKDTERLRKSYEERLADFRKNNKFLRSRKEIEEKQKMLKEISHIVHPSLPLFIDWVLKEGNEKDQKILFEIWQGIYDAHKRAHPNE